MFANSVNPWPSNTSPLGTGEKTAILEKKGEIYNQEGRRSTEGQYWGG